jgi:hypothetical protein
MAERERHESFEDTKFGIGQNTDGTFNAFPLSELAAKTAARDAAEAEGLEEQGDVDELADEYRTRLGAGDAKLPHDQVAYGPGHEPEFCRACRFYLAEGHCRMVADPIDPDGWCNLWKAKNGVE